MNAHYNFAEIYVSKDHQVGLRAPSVFSCVIFGVLEIDKKREEGKQYKDHNRERIEIQ